MWEGINEAGSDFWANLEPFPWARRLYEELGKIAPVTLLTSPSEALEAPAGKIRWIRQHIKTKNYIITQVKEQCAHSHAILIDDNKQFIDRFAEYGGMTFHFPNALRILDGEVDIDDVISRLCRYLRSKRKFPIY